MTDQPERETASSTSPPAANEQNPPDRELELKLKRSPENLDHKTDVGSDESMDASDPIAATQPGGNEPAPSSSFPQDK